MNTELNDIASKSLGSSASYAIYTETFDPTLLNPMPRKLAREGWGIRGDEFVGFDVWHCHEATFLLNNGAPVAGTLKFLYPSDSEYMIESKSMKLYLNTFDMCKMGDRLEDAINNYEKQVQNDLQKVLNTGVKIKFHQSGSDHTGVFPFQRQDYADLHEVLSGTLSNIEITDYSAEKKHLTFMTPTMSPHAGFDSATNKKIFTNKYCTNVLRSRCRHTKQKDTGTAYVRIDTLDSLVSPESLFKQIVSLREVNEFHEFCAEKLYTEIMSYPQVLSCCVSLLYSRRGSLDINPCRATTYEMLPLVLASCECYTGKAMGQ